MAGFTGASFRLLCREQGADFTMTEMVSAKSLLFDHVRTWELLDTESGEGPVIVQLFGNEPDTVARAARRVCERMGAKVAAIDLNMGCPAPKVTGNGEGSALMRDIPLAADIVRAAAEAAKLPVTVKFRRGWDDAHDNAVEFAQNMERAGAALLTVHPRTRAQMYAGRADWSVIARVKAAVDVPVIGNGDVSSGADALAMLEQAGCDGVMVGRAALGNPFIFAEIRAAFDGGAYARPSRETIAELALRHAAMEEQKKGRRGLVEMRKHVAFYVRGFPNAARLRARAVKAETLEDFKEILT